jgi:AcrR family transcriptional regulator
MTKSDRKQREFQRREQEIVDTALRLFKQGDLHAVTIEQIAEATDIGKGTVYKHFKSKDEIFARIIIQLNRAMRAEIATIDSKQPFRERFLQIIEVIWRHDMQDSQFLHRLNLHVLSSNFQQNLGPNMQSAMNELKQEDGEFYYQLLLDAQQRGEIINQPLEELLFCATAAVDGAILHYWSMEASGLVNEQDSQRYLRQLQEFVYRALTVTK